MKELHKKDATLARLLPPQKPEPGVAYVPSQFALTFLKRPKPLYPFEEITEDLIPAPKRFR